MDLKLKGKVALITGSTAGIGRAIATLLAAEGAHVIVNGRSEGRVAAAVKDIAAIRSVHGEAAIVTGWAGDLTDPKEAKRLTRQIPAVDILVNNLGVFNAKPLSDLEDSDWQGMFDVNVLSGARLAQAYLPHMRRADWGRVLFIASETAVNIPPDMIHYGVSKAAQVALARGLAETTAGTGITVNSVLPGPTLSEGVTDFLASLPLDEGATPEESQASFLRSMRPTSLARRFARAEEVAGIVAWLASPLASMTNGAALRVEGGLLRSVY